MKSPIGEELEEKGFVNNEDEVLEPVIECIEFCVQRLIMDNENGTLIVTLEVRYIASIQGRDPVCSNTVLLADN